MIRALHSSDIDGTIGLISASEMFAPANVEEIQYGKCGFSKVACIPDFYDDGDDKIVFIKSLAR